MGKNRNIRTSSKSKRKCMFIGCVHLLPLPGSHKWGGDMDVVFTRALEDAAVLVKAGVDGLVVENTHDAPYLRQTAEAATIASCAWVARMLRSQTGITIGINLLAGADVEAMDVAIVAQAQFIRAEGFVFGHVADEGIIQGEAARILRRRTHLGGQSVEVWADIKKKHSSHAITGDLNLVESAKGAAYSGADAVVVTGPFTGEPPRFEDARQLIGVGPKIVIGSGVDAQNAGEFATVADALIVGSATKYDGHWSNPVEPRRAKRLVEIVRATQGDR